MPDANQSTTKRVGRRSVLKITGLSLLGMTGPVRASTNSHTDVNQDSTISSAKASGDKEVGGTSNPALLRTVPDHTVILLPKKILGYHQHISADVEVIYYRLPWKTVGDEGWENLEELLDVTEYTFVIDEKRVSGSDGTWSLEKIHDTTADQPQWRLQWTYAAPPNPPGIYDFETIITFTQPYTGNTSSGGSKTWQGTYRYQDSYTVVPARRNPTEDTG